MTIKNAKTVLFATLLLAMILPFSMADMADAKKSPYSLEKIDRVFAASTNYLTYDDDGKMKLDAKGMKKQDNVNKSDVKLMKKWVKLNNKLIKAMDSKDQKKIDKAMDKIENGRFSLLTNPVSTPPAAESARGQISLKSHVTPNWLTLSACGITYGTSSHPNPAYSINYHGYSSKAALQSGLTSAGYDKLGPFTGGADFDLWLKGLDYGKINTTGYGGCTGGEFRDQNVIIDGKDFTYNGVYYPGWGAQQQINEPNPNINEYIAPTPWWNIYVYQWHEGN